MPSAARKQKENDFQVAFKIPSEWLERADKIARMHSQPGMTWTRTDVLRRALYAGMLDLERAHREHSGTKR